MVRQQLISLTALAVSCAIAAPALAKKRPPPDLIVTVRDGKARLGSEVLRSKRGETKTYFSTKTKMRHKGRSFTHRTHTILDAKGKLVTYDRWLDVKGATLRIRLFAFKDKWKRVEFAQNPKAKNKVTAVAIKRPVVVLDQRSPTLLDLAVERFRTNEELNWVRADNLQTGTMKLTIERLVDAAGKKYARYKLTGTNLNASVLRGPNGKALKIDTGWGFTGTARGKIPKDLRPAPDAGAEAPAEPAEAGKAEPKTDAGKAEPKTDAGDTKKADVKKADAKKADAKKAEAKKAEKKPGA